MRTTQGPATTTRSATRWCASTSYDSVMQAPKLVKVTLNMGVGEAKQDAKMLEAAREQLATIAGQQPNVRRARKSVAAFKLREGMPVGLVGDAARGARLRVPRPADLRSRSPGSATSAASTRARSTGAATTRWASASRSSSRRSTTTPSTRSGPGRDDHHHRYDRRRGVRPAGRAGHALLPRGPSRRVREPRRRAGGRVRKPWRPMAKTSQIVRAAAPAEVQDPSVLALPPLRPSARGVPQVRHLPDLPARARARGLHPRHDEVELVIACR